MIGFFTPRYIRNGKEMLHAARKMYHYKRDLLSPSDVSHVEAELARLSGALRSRNRAEIESASQELDRFFGERIPVPKHPEIQENCEVFLVAIVIALGIRTFFIQPFTIPTGSMQPTLNGIIATSTETPPPNVLARVVDMILYGRSYFNVVSATDDTVRSVRDVTRFVFLTRAEVICDKQRFSIPAPATAVMRTFGIAAGVPLKAGQVVARGFVNTGDHVFVNKVAYNFRHPHRGEVFVFNTAGIDKLNIPGTPSQFYIKRLTGLPGDELRVDPPHLFVNGRLASGAAFERVMAGTPLAPKDDYKGYGNGPEFLTSPESTYRVPEKHYFAMGDNSYNSSDSRYWGTVPEQNLVGCGMFVYWPFTKHWGLIR
jgi:signal peptidase I